jgi:hypothetical protein
VLELALWNLGKRLRFRRGETELCADRRWVIEKLIPNRRIDEETGHRALDFG